MLPLSVHKRSPDRGFTLVELLTVLVLVSIASALAAPNMISWLHAQKLQSATELVQGAMQDAQQQAIRLGKKCVLQLDGALNDSPVAGMTSYDRMKAKPVDGNNREQCLVATADERSLTLPQETRMVTNIEAVNGVPEITFSFRGHVTSNFGDSRDADFGKNFPMIVVYSTLDNSSNDNSRQRPKRCVVIASLLGAIRTGVYQGTLTNLDARECQTHIEGVRS